MPEAFCAGKVIENHDLGFIFEIFWDDQKLMSECLRSLKNVFEMFSSVFEMWCEALSLGEGQNPLRVDFGS